MNKTLLSKRLNELTFAWNKIKRRFEKTERRRAYIYLLMKTPYEETEKKSWEDIRAGRDKFEPETKREDIYYDIYNYWFTIYVYRWSCNET